MKRPDAPTIRETLRGVRKTLDAAGVDSPDVEADRLLARVLGVERSRLALRAGEPLEADAATRLARLLERRTAGEPLQHLEGTVDFRGLVLRADRRALIPRPETEQLVDLVIRELRADEAGRDDGGKGGVRTVRRPGPLVERALDVGTGSGAIALSLAAEGITARVVGLDVSEAALEQARENREAAGLSATRVEFRACGSDPFDALETDETFELVVSNPPYVRDDELEGLPAEIRDHEPRAALAGGPDGLDLVRAIARRAPEHLVLGGRLLVEIGAGHGRDAVEIVTAAPAWTDVACRTDLAGRDRFLVARRS